MERRIAEPAESKRGRAAHAPGRVVQQRHNHVDAVGISDITESADRPGANHYVLVVECELPQARKRFLGTQLPEDLCRCCAHVRIGRIEEPKKRLAGLDRSELAQELGG